MTIFDFSDIQVKYIWPKEMQANSGKKSVYMTKFGDPRLLYGKNVQQTIMAGVQKTISRLSE